MKKSALITALQSAPDALVRFKLPDGALTPAHAHVSEVARVSKRFIDCGGTFREEVSCRLQTWVADDVAHRLPAGKLAKIISKAEPVLGAEDLDVDVEHDVGFVTQFSISDASLQGGEVILRLAGRHTACLAMDVCCPPQAQNPVITLGKKG